MDTWLSVHLALPSSRVDCWALRSVSVELVSGLGGAALSLAMIAVGGGDGHPNNFLTDSFSSGVFRAKLVLDVDFPMADDGVDPFRISGLFRSFPISRHVFLFFVVVDKSSGCERASGDDGGFSSSWEVSLSQEPSRFTRAPFPSGKRYQAKSFSFLPNPRGPLSRKVYYYRGRDCIPTNHCTISVFQTKLTQIRYFFWFKFSKNPRLLSMTILCSSIMPK